MRKIEKFLIAVSKKVQGRFRKAVLILFDIFIFAFIEAIYYIGMKYIYHDMIYISDSLRGFLFGSGILIVSVFAVRFILGIYRHIWRYTNIGAYLMLVLADGIACIISIIAGNILKRDYYNGSWFSITVCAMALLLTLVSRFIYRGIYKRVYKNDHTNDTAKIPNTNIAIVGAGQLGASLAAEISYNYSLGYKICCFFDDDYGKSGDYISGIKVERSKDAVRVIQKYDIKECIIAIDKVSNEHLANLYAKYKILGLKVKIYDSPFSQGNAPEKRSTKKVIRDFSIEDLLFRDSLDFVGDDVRSYYSGKTVLITGGGGSIGSEICRQIAKCVPKRIIIFDIYENNAYDIQQELTRSYGKSLDLCVEIGSVRDYDRLKSVFEYYKPQIVFHAAAHKHVPLMEHSACEAVKNNVFGTYNTVNVAEQAGVEKFILISTDKAVNPTNIMGASKRLCEMIVRSHFDSKTCFAAVRFGNVLGSNGSVIPLFKRQIEAGGPVTITDKRIIRYFMTIPEASQLVLTAGTMAKKNELFVLDMGNPVKIYDLCVNMIKLMGLEPEKDIEIKEIGLRPGEKLYEELLVQSETLSKTENNRIFIERDAPIDKAEMASKLSLLANAVNESKGGIDMKAIEKAMHEVVPTYFSPESVNENAQRAKEMQLANS